MTNGVAMGTIPECSDSNVVLHMRLRGRKGQTKGGAPSMRGLWVYSRALTRFGMVKEKPRVHLQQEHTGAVAGVGVFVAVVPGINVDACLASKLAH